jgi:putative endopeptidase
VYLSVGVNLSDADAVNVHQIDYLSNVSSLVDRCPSRVVQNYLVWCLVLNVMDAMPRRFQLAKQKLTKLTEGTSAEKSRSIRCSSTVNNAMGFAVSRLYIEKYFSAKSRSQVNLVVGDCRYHSSTSSSRWNCVE